MSIRVFIVEDEFIHIEAIKIALEEAGFELAGECNDADSAFDKIKMAQPDVVLIDIALPGVNNGITLADRVHVELNIPHVFITSFTQESIIDQAISTKPAGYLHKPVDWVTLKAVVQIALVKKSPAPFLAGVESNHGSDFIKVGDKLVRVDLNDVLMVKADGDNCIALVTEKKQFSIRSTLKEYSSKLPAGFIQVHRSYIINLHHLDSFNERVQTAFLKGRQAPVARNFRKTFLEMLRKM